MNATVLIIVILVVCAGLALWKMISDKRKGKSACGSCAGCPYSKDCSKKPPSDS